MHIMYWLYLYPVITLLLFVPSTANAQSSTTTLRSLSTGDGGGVDSAKPPCLQIDDEHVDTDSLISAVVDVTLPPQTTSLATITPLSSPQQLLQPRMQQHKHHILPDRRRHQSSTRRHLTSDERHELQRRAMHDALLHHQQLQQQQQQQQNDNHQPLHSSYFSSVQEMRSYYYFHSGVINIAAENAIRMASSASGLSSSTSSPDIDAADSATTAEMDDGHDIKSIDDEMEEEEEEEEEDEKYKFDADSNLYDTVDMDNDYIGNGEDYLLYQSAQNAIENALMQIEHDLEELMLVKLANDDKFRTREDDDAYYDVIRQDEVPRKVAGASNDLCQLGNQVPEASKSSLSMSMNFVNSNKNNKRLSTESDGSSCSNIHPIKKEKKLAPFLSTTTTTFTNVEYSNIQHRLNCPSRQYRYRITDSISLTDAIEKWRMMRQRFWKLFDIPIHEDEQADDFIKEDRSAHASASTSSSQTLEDNVHGMEYYHYKYIPNPDLYVDFLSSSSLSSSSSSFGTSSSSSSSSSSSETASKMKRGLFAARDFERGEVVYTHSKNSLYFQELSSWEAYLNSLQRQQQLSSASNTNHTISHTKDEVEDACLAVEWSFTKQISRPGRFLVMLVLDVGVYMRRNVAATPSADATSAASNFANEEDVDSDEDDDDDNGSNEDDDDEDDEWLEGNVALSDERSLDFVALRIIRMGEEIIDAGIELDVDE